MAKHKKKPADMTLEELRAEAASRNIEGRSAMHKDELVAALSGEQSGGDETADENQRTPPYPPSTSDSAGEKTDNIAPAKKGFAAPAPESENPKPKADVPTAQQALAQADAETARLKARVAELEKLANDKGILLPGDPANTRSAARVAMRKATVTPVGGSPMEVEIPADTPDEGRDQAAIEAWKQRAGVWSAPQTPHVDHGEK